MKTFSLSLAFGTMSMVVSAQFGTAPDFTVTDIDGNTHSLYADILDQGLIAVVEVSSTWCGNCWNLHQSGAMQALHESHGPDGTNQLRVIFYEADPNTDLNALQGISGSTIGDWTEGVTYPMVNESPLTLNMNVWAPFSTPVVNVVRPSDREIVLDLFNVFSVEAQVEAINGADIDGIVLGTVDAAELEAPEPTVTVFPNPSSGEFVLGLESFKGQANVDVFNLVGRKVWSAQMNGQASNGHVDLRGLESGNYLVQVSDGLSKLTRRVTVMD